MIRLGGKGVRIALLAVLTVPSILLYARVTGAFFCSYDDFYEVHRAAFEDARDPARIFTTAHFGSQRYRPLNRASNDLTYRLGAFGGSRSGRATWPSKSSTWRSSTGSLSCSSGVAGSRCWARLCSPYTRS